MSISLPHKHAIKRLTRQIAKKSDELDQLRVELARELLAAHEEDKSTLDELGRLVGVSRQRIHQLVKK